MNVSEILSIVDSENIQLWVDQGGLKFRAQKGKLSEELKELLKENKAALIEELEKQSAKEERDIYPLSYNQQSLWFLHQLTSSQPSYNIAAACRIVTTINIDSLLYSLEKLILRHQVLRTTFLLSEKDNSLLQKVQPNIKIPFEHIDASGWPVDEIHDKVKAYYKKPFDLEKGPVFRVQLFSIQNQDHILLFTIHHIACDGWSLNILLTEFSHILKNRATGTDNNLQPALVQYADYVKYQREILNGRFGETALSYWKNKLQTFPTSLNLPTDLPRPAVQTYLGSSYFFNFEGFFYTQIKKFAKENKVTLYSLLLSIYQLLLFHLSDQKKVLVGTPSACRNIPEFREVCGYFVNPIVICSEYHDSVTFREHLIEISKTVYESLDYQEYPFPLLVENLLIDHSPDISPIFQVMFNLINRKTLGIAADFFCSSEDSEPSEFGDLKILPFPIAQQEGQYDMTFEVIDTDQRLFCVLKYNIDLFKLATIEKMVDNYQNLLRDVIEAPDKLLSDLVCKIKKTPSRTEPSAKKKVTITVSATFTIELLEKSLGFWMKKLNIDSDIVFTPYNQVFQQLLDSTSLFYKNTDGINLLFIRFDDWLHSQGSNIETIKKITDKNLENIKRNAKEFLHAVETSSKKTAASCVILFCPPSPILMENSDYQSLVQKMEHDLLTSLNGMSGVYAVPFKETLSVYPVNTYYEPMGEDIGHIPYTPQFFVAISTLIARKIFSIVNKPYKAIILDCDNTLWNGIVGEDGTLGVTIDDNKKWFHEFIINQYNAGVLICLCSKNNEEDVMEVFNHHPDMILKLEHIASSRVNWLPKSANLQALAKELNIGLDSFIFIDDSLMECSEVKAGCPEVLTIQFPSNHVDLKKFFSHLWAFDYLKITLEDKKRSEYYKDSQNREQFLKESIDFKNFIKGLNLDIQISEMTSSQILRVSQLTQRVNQFNMTTIRRTESEIEKIGSSSTHKCFTVTVSDRFGEYGLVGLIIAEFIDQSCVVDTMLLSCRALGRGVEHHMLSYLGKVAQEEQCDHVKLTYLPTKKNIPVRDFLQTVAEEFGEGSHESIQYTLPSSVAADIVFVPKEPLLILDDKPKKDKPAIKYHRNNIPDLNSLLIEIATELSEVSKIQNLIQPQKATKKAVSLDPSHQNKMISQITDVWCSVLCIEKINPDDNFFEIGGKSIFIPLIVIQLKKKYDIDISIVNVLQYPTIASLTNYLAANTTFSTDHISIQADKQKEALSKQKQRAMVARKIKRKKK